MRTHNMRFYKENQKKGANTLHKHHFMSLLLIFFFFFKCTLNVGRYIFYHKFLSFLSILEKLKHTVQ